MKVQKLIVMVIDHVKGHNLMVQILKKLNAMVIYHVVIVLSSFVVQINNYTFVLYSGHGISNIRQKISECDHGFGDYKIKLIYHH